MNTAGVCLTCHKHHTGCVCIEKAPPSQRLNDAGVCVVCRKHHTSCRCEPAAPVSPATPAAPVSPATPAAPVLPATPTRISGVRRCDVCGADVRHISDTGLCPDCTDAAESIIETEMPTVEAGPMLCEHGLPVAVHQVLRGKACNRGRWFARCPLDHRVEEQCHTFVWLDCRPPQADAPSGSANLLLHLPDGDGVALLDAAKETPANVTFEPVEGGAIEFKLDNSDKVLGRVTVDENINAEVMVPDEIKAEAHASIADGVNAAEPDRVKDLAKRLRYIRKGAPAANRWKHTLGTTNTDLARVMVAMRDTIDKWCFLAPKAKDEAWRFLCDSCTDTHLLALSYVKAKGLENKINKSVVRNIGTANAGVAFKAVGTLELELEIRDIRGTWHTLVLTWHVADIGHKCLVNTTDLRKAGWRFVQQNNPDGTDGTCLIAPDGAVFALGGDDHDMPILPTRSAPVVCGSKPSTLRRVAEQLLHMAKYGGKPAPPQPKRRPHRAAVTFGADTSDDTDESPSESETDTDEWETEDEDARCMANVAGDIERMKGKRPRAKAVIHTPDSWHNLVHAGQVLSEASAKNSSARFEVNGKVKLGHELSSSDLAELEAARARCNVCKQTKLTAPAARRAGRAHASHGSVTYRPE